MTLEETGGLLPRNREAVLPIAKKYRVPFCIA